MSEFWNSDGWHPVSATWSSEPTEFEECSAEEAAAYRLAFGNAWTEVAADENGQTVLRHLRPKPRHAER